MKHLFNISDFSPFKPKILQLYVLKAARSNLLTSSIYHTSTHNPHLPICTHTSSKTHLHPRASSNTPSLHQNSRPSPSHITQKQTSITKPSNTPAINPHVTLLTNSIHNIPTISCETTATSMPLNNMTY